MLTIIAVLVAIFAYLLGSVNTSIILSKAIYGEDIRKSGSGNAGATNMLRTHGKGIAIATLICDVLKGSLAVFLACLVDAAVEKTGANTNLSPTEKLYIWGNLKYIAGIFVVLGHDFPVFFGFRGGKGVATSLGVALALDWQAALIIAVIALIIMATTRYVSLGSICAGALYPFVLFTYLFITKHAELDKYLAYIAMSFVLGILLIVKHHSNIRKLLSGTESKLFETKKGALEGDSDNTDETDDDSDSCDETDDEEYSECDEEEKE